MTGPSWKWSSHIWGKISRRRGATAPALRTRGPDALQDATHLMPHLMPHPRPPRPPMQSHHQLMCRRPSLPLHFPAASARPKLTRHRAPPAPPALRPRSCTASQSSCKLGMSLSALGFRRQARTADRILWLDSNKGHRRVLPDARRADCMPPRPISNRLRHR